MRVEVTSALGGREREGGWFNKLTVFRGCFFLLFVSFRFFFVLRVTNAKATALVGDGR